MDAREGRLPEMALSERDRAILDFERTWWAEPGPKELAIRQRFDLSATRAGILAEILDELAARLRPGIHSGVIHYSAYDLARFLDRPFRFV